VASFSLALFSSNEICTVFSEMDNSSSNFILLNWGDAGDCNRQNNAINIMRAYYSVGDWLCTQK